MDLTIRKARVLKITDLDRTLPVPTQERISRLEKFNLSNKFFCLEKFNEVIQLNAGYSCAVVKQDLSIPR